MSLSSTNIFKTLLGAVFNVFIFFLKILIPFFIILCIIGFLCVIHILKLRYIDHLHPKLRMFPYKFSYKGKRYVIDLPGSYINTFPGILKNIFVLFPRIFAFDFLNQDPNAFSEFGIHMVCGEQGSGKTITVVYLLQKWKAMYPRLKIYTNMAYKYEDGELIAWQQLLEHNNGIYGVVNVIDEIKTWWSNKDSKDVPPEMLGEICQQRKQKKATIGTVQVFSELAKPFRSQTHFVYIPRTYFGCLTVVFVSKPKYYNPETDSFRKKTGFFLFAHTKKLRDAYDTYKKIEKYKDFEFAKSSAFIDSSEDLMHVCAESSELHRSRT